MRPLTASEPDARSAEPIATLEQAYDDDQTFRYSEASGDPMPIHLDDDIAKAMGLPGIIIHGLCTMAFNSRAIVSETCWDDPGRLSRLAVRFSRPALPKQTITTDDLVGRRRRQRPRVVLVRVDERRRRNGDQGRARRSRELSFRPKEN